MFGCTPSSLAALVTERVASVGLDGRVVGTARWRKCEVVVARLPISQFLPIVRWSRPVSRSRPAGQPDPGEGGDDGTESDHDDGQHGEAAGRRPVPDPGRSCADRPPRCPGSARPPSRPARSPASLPARRPSTGDAADGSRDGADDGRQRAPSAMSTTPPARQRPPRRAVGARSPPVRTRIASSGSSVVSTSGRPRPAVSRGAPASSRPGTPTTIACSTDETCSTQQADRRPGCGPGRHPIDEVGRGPDRFARDDDEPDVERARRRRRWPRAPRGSRTAPAPGRPRTTPSRRARTCSRVRRKTSGRWASSSNSSSASIRPRIRDVSRPAAGRERSCLGDADLGRRGEQPADAVARAERAQDEDARRRARRSRRPSGMRGDTAAMIRAGHERARRNLHDTWALRRSQPLVSLGPSGLVTNGRGRRRTGSIGSSTVWRRIRAVIHRRVHSRAARPPVVRSARGPPRRRIERGDLAVEAGQHQPAAEQVGGGHHLGMGDPPGDRSRRARWRTSRSRPGR